MIIKCTVNGRMYQREISEPRLLLVHFLRDELLLTGTHIGCDTGHCGACTIMLNGKTVKSCMVLAVQADGCEIKTIEGLSREDDSGRLVLDPIQLAFAENHALQCGYCTPGMIMSTYYLLLHNANPTASEIANAIEGNLCMCTGYNNIVKAIKSVAEERNKSPSRGNGV